jgi:hypothetical protein
LQTGSIDRIKHSNPKPDLINFVRQKLPLARIVCTQLSKHCSSELPTTFPNHLTNTYAKGKVEKKCCGGTIEINLDKVITALLPEFNEHQKFISESAPNALCMK